MAKFVNSQGVELQDLEDLVRYIDGHKDQFPSDSVLGLWEEYEDCFSSDPYAYAMLEMQRVLHHLKALPDEMTPIQKYHVRNLTTAIAYASAATPQLDGITPD